MKEKQEKKLDTRRLTRRFTIIFKYLVTVALGAK